MKILSLISLLFLSGCAFLTPQVLSVGLREQFVEKNQAMSTTEYAVYDVKDAQVNGGNFSLYRGGAQNPELVARYKVTQREEVAEVPIEQPTGIESKIRKEELSCITCVAPRRYRKPYGYLSYPLLVLTVPLDTIATAVAAPVMAIGLLTFSAMVQVSCYMNNVHPCHE